LWQQKTNYGSRCALIRASARTRKGLTTPGDLFEHDTLSRGVIGVQRKSLPYAVVSQTDFARGGGVVVFAQNDEKLAIAKQQVVPRD
jgi:hypothetical protein